MQITKKDVKEVADAISGRFERDIVRRVTMGLLVDEDFGDCIRCWLEKLSPWWTSKCFFEAQCSAIRSELSSPRVPDFGPDPVEMPWQQQISESPFPVGVQRPLPPLL